MLQARAPALERLVRTHGVADYSPIRVDSLASVFNQIDDASPPLIAAQWRALIWGHPLLYLRVRAAAFHWVFLTPDPAACGLVFTGVDGAAGGDGAGRPANRARAPTDDALASYALAFAARRSSRMRLTPWSAWRC